MVKRIKSSYRRKLLMISLVVSIFGQGTLVPVDEVMRPWTIGSVRLLRSEMRSSTSSSIWPRLCRKVTQFRLSVAIMPDLPSDLNCIRDKTTI